MANGISKWGPRSLAQTAAVMGLLGLLVTFATGALVVWVEYGRRFEQAREQASVEAYFLADHASRLFELSRIALDTVTSDIGDMDWDTIARSAPLHRLLGALADTLPHIEDLWLNDQSGVLRATSYAFPAPPSDAADRPNFKAARSQDGGLFIGPLITGRVTHAPTFLISRRLEWPDHSLRGMVSATADVGYFIEYWQRLNLPYDARVTLYSAEQSNVLAQFPSPDTGARQFGIASDGSVGGTFDALAHEARFGAYRKVEGGPLYVAVDISRRAVIAGWRTWLFTSLPFPIAGLIGFALLGLLAVRQGRIEALAAARLAAANEKLTAEIAGRELAEEQMRQMQKMEVIGQLTGGIAHDFNNMLAIVIGNLSLLRKRLERGEQNVQRYLGAAEDGAQRAASLTRRLLAFARRQPLVPQSIDINKFVANISELLRRTLTETVQIETVLAGGLWRTCVDPAQLESAVLNLAINARDAMPDGGKLTIETGNTSLDAGYAARHAGAPPGQYVLLAISDTGLGMNPEVVAKAFEPFFTTKAAGSGTGLGLSQVHGFVRQSGGHVKIYSEPGQGTTVKMYFPRDYGPAKPEEASPASPGVPQSRHGETILVVEDEEAVRNASVDGLRELGYTVLQAEGAAAALRVLEANPTIDLLFTDVVMPDVNGKQLAEEALARHRRLRVLFTTGYTPNAIVHNGLLDPGVNLLGKPFTIEQLARAVRDALDRA